MSTWVRTSLPARLPRTVQSCPHVLRPRTPSGLRRSPVDDPIPSPEFCSKSKITISLSDELRKLFGADGGFVTFPATPRARSHVNPDFS